MVESLVKKIDSKRILRSNIDKYKEYLIKFYGESERKRIEEAFSKILLIPYVIPLSAAMNLCELQKEITNSILEKYCEKLKPGELDGYGDFSSLDGFYLYQYTQLVEELNKETKDEEKINKLFKDLKSLLEKIDKGITPSNFFDFSDNPIYQELEHLSRNFSSMKQEFDEISSKFKSYEESVRKEWKMEAAIERKWYKKFIESSLTNLPENIKKDAEKYLVSDETRIPESIKKIFGGGIKNLSVPNNFISEAQQQKINESKEEYIKAYKLEVQKNHFICKKYQEELDALGLLNPVKLEEEMIGAITACLPNVRKVNGKYDIFCPILISFEAKEKGKIDHNIIHELNHLIELTILDANDEGYSILSGWDLITYCKDKSKENNSRKYELFSEAINELIAQDICKEMHNDDFFLFDSKKTTYNESGYEPTLYLVKEFYEKYKNQILESRKEGNISIIWDTVGKENFDDLNSLFEAHYDRKRDQIRTYLPKEMKEKQESKRDEILRHMEEYSKQNLEEDNFEKKQIKRD